MLMQTEVTAGSKESDELEVLSILIKEYEHENHAVPQPNPPGAIRFRMGQLNTSEAEFIDSN
jgi:HTH-type transcriptional regulator/antitoxin HigA